MRVTYEWDLETVDGAGDITDHDFDISLSDLLSRLVDPARQRLALVRNGRDGSRLWAYPCDGDFSRGEFQDCGPDGPTYPGVRIPRRLIREFRRATPPPLTGEKQSVRIESQPPQKGI